MQLAFHGQCYASNAEALAAFRNSFPLLGDANWTSHVSSSIDAYGLLTYLVTTRPITSNVLSIRTGTIQLVSCDPVDAPVFDPVAAGGVFAFFFLGVAGAWYLSKNLGLIIEAVRKF